MFLVVRHLEILDTVLAIAEVLAPVRPKPHYSIAQVSKNLYSEILQEQSQTSLDQVRICNFSVRSHGSLIADSNNVVDLVGLLHSGSSFLRSLFQLVATSEL